MTDFPGWHSDPTGRHPERYFDSSGLPTPLVRSGGQEFTDFDTLHPAPPPFVQSAPTDAYDPPTLQVPAVTPPPPPPRRSKRNWWLIGAACLLVVLFAAAVTAAFQQHSDATTWKHDDQAEQSKYEGEAHRAQSLSATLASTKQQLSSVTNQKNTAVSKDNVLATALQDAASIASDLSMCVSDTDTMINDATTSLNTGLLDPTLDIDATTAGDVCREAQSENATMQQALSGG
jgi:uncharacterized protein HemX